MAEVSGQLTPDIPRESRGGRAGPQPASRAAKKISSSPPDHRSQLLVCKAGSQHKSGAEAELRIRGRRCVLRRRLLQVDRFRTNDLEGRRTTASLTVNDRFGSKGTFASLEQWPARKIQHLENEAGLPTLADIEAIRREFEVQTWHHRLKNDMPV
jgi:hypothetical protein